MTTMTFPITDVTLPNDEWEMKSFKEMKSLSEETMCFTATMVHKPSGMKFLVKNNGHGGENSYEAFTTDYEKFKTVRAEWAKFVSQCGEAMRKSVEGQEDWMQDLYDDFGQADGSWNGMDSDSVIGLFTAELDNQGMLSRKRGTVVRTPESKSSFAIYSNYTPEQMAGQVVGEWWDKKVKNWVTI